MTTIEFIIIAIINVVSIFLTSYFGQKGKNSAMKRDIEEITSKIKSVESAISEISSKKQDKFFQFRTAITDFANDLTILVEWKFKTIPIGNDIMNPNIIRESFLGFMSHWAKVNSSYRRVLLFSYVEKKFYEKIQDQLIIIIKQYKITIELYEVLLIQSAILYVDKGSRTSAIKISEAQKNYLSHRDGDEKIGLKSFDAYNIILKLLHEKLMEKYETK